jgi:hypothetical protein
LSDAERGTFRGGHKVEGLGHRHPL